MKISVPGHMYLLESLDGSWSQVLNFVKRVGDKFPFNHEPASSGTNCQEVLRALIDRCEYLNKQDPCAETQMIIASLQNALLLFELRAARRHGRHLDLESVARLSCGPFCKTCGHYGCGESH